MLEGSSVAARTRAVRSLRAGSVVAVALAAGFVAWLFVRDGAVDQPAAPAVAADTQPQLVSEARLRSLAARLPYSVYWAAPRHGLRYELTQEGSRTYVRYLPGSVSAGDPRPRFLAVGTYADPAAFAQTRTAGKRPGAVTFRLGGGGIAVYSKEHPTSVYFSYPGSSVQVEVFHPNASIARRLVLTHRIVPIT